MAVARLNCSCAEALQEIGRISLLAHAHPIGLAVREMPMQIGTMQCGCAPWLFLKRVVWLEP
jgi:hypothetical protein